MILQNSSNIQVSSSFVFENLKILFSNQHPDMIEIFYNGLEPAVLFVGLKTTRPKNFNSKG